MANPLTELINTYIITPIASDPYWEATAFVGEAVFGGRFILQWIVSEYKKRSIVPKAFWYMSVIGSLILLVYSIHIEKPVLILAFTLQIGIYARNLHLIKRTTKTEAALTQAAKNTDLTENNTS